MTEGFVPIFIELAQISTLFQSFQALWTSDRSFVSLQTFLIRFELSIRSKSKHLYFSNWISSCHLLARTRSAANSLRRKKTEWKFFFNIARSWYTFGILLKRVWAKFRVNLHYLGYCTCIKARKTKQLLRVYKRTQLAISYRRGIIFAFESASISPLVALYSFDGFLYKSHLHNKGCFSYHSVDAVCIEYLESW